MATKSKPVDHVEAFARVGIPAPSKPTYRYQVWVYQKDGEDQYTGEVPQIDAVKDVKCDSIQNALFWCTHNVAHLRNNRGRPKPLVVKKLESLGKQPPEGATVRTYGVS